MLYKNYIESVKGFSKDRYSRGEASAPLLIDRDGDLTVEYAPFDHIQSGAELAIVGLTPGRVQATNALSSMSADLRKGVPVETALENAKRFASFSGPMRANLLAMLDALEIPKVFGREKAADFFAEKSKLVHFTSALRYPVYVSGKNYSGSPQPLKHPMLRRHIDSCLVEEVDTLPNAIWIPLGKHAESALLYLSDRGLIPRERILGGLPHPSGANAERIAYFLGRKERSALSGKTNATAIDQAKAKLLTQVASLQ